MDIVIVGGGAIGLLVAARLAESGERVALLARSNAAALAQGGIALAEAGQERAIRSVQIFSDPAAPPVRPELAILCVKGYDTPAAMDTLAQLGASSILTLQNGIGHEEALAERFGPGRVISGAITTSVDVAGEGRVAVTKQGGVGLAPVAGQQLGALAQTFARAGFTTKTYASHQAMKWSKALLNMLGNATAAILDRSVAQVYADDALVALERQAFREALAVMDRMGIRPVSLPRYPAAPLALAMRYAPPPLLYPLLRRTVAGGRGSKLPSLLIELRRGNPRSEGRFLYGAVAEQAARLGLPAPANTALWATLQGIAEGRIAWDDYRHNPSRLIAAASGRPAKV